MIRSAAKNHAAVAVVSSPSQYAEVLAELSANDGALSRNLRRRLAAAAFATTAAYDAEISSWFSGQLGNDATHFTRTYVKELTLKYGCNPHQEPAFVGRLADLPSMPFKGAQRRQWRSRSRDNNSNIMQRKQISLRTPLCLLDLRATSQYLTASPATSICWTPATRGSSRRSSRR